VEALTDAGDCLCQVSYTLQVSIEKTSPEDVVKMALEKCQSRSAVVLDSYDNYVLRVSGRDEYFLGSDPLSRFKVCDFFSCNDVIGLLIGSAISVI